MRRVWIAVPAYTGQAHLGTVRTLLTEVLALSALGDDVTVFDEVGNGLIGDARAIIVAKARAENCTHLIWLDQDVVAPAGTFQRLLDAPVDMAVACYPQRKDPIEFAMRWDQTKSELWADPKTGLLSVAGTPFGCVMTTRAMLDRMCEQYSDLDFYCHTAPNNRACALFSDYWLPATEPSAPRLKLGEDYAFCQRWLDMGGQVWVDPEITLGHVGYKTFTGNLGQWLRDRPGTQEAAMAHAVRDLSIADLFGEIPGLKTDHLPQPVRAFA
mgnify:CR=1 FL=1